MEVGIAVALLLFTAVKWFWVSYILRLTYYMPESPLGPQTLEFLNCFIFSPSIKIVTADSKEWLSELW